jgi:hypothetical protein
MSALAPFLGTLLLLQSSPSPAPARANAPAKAARQAPHAAPAHPASLSPPAKASAEKGKGPVILFLVDNSASLPPLDPDEQRVAALGRSSPFSRASPIG